jgi:hypothetical protein
LKAAEFNRLHTGAYTDDTSKTKDSSRIGFYSGARGGRVRLDG